MEAGTPPRGVVLETPRGRGRPRPLRVTPLEQTPEKLVEVCAGSRREAHELALVLHALRIPHHLLRARGRTHILVPADRVVEARRELEQYASEGPLRAASPAPADRSAGFFAAGLWCLVLSLVHTCMTRVPAVAAWREAGVSTAADVRAGEWWRTITALTLHADIVHLLSNLVFGALFVGLLAAETGVGLALLLTLLGGALGNGANALLAEVPHHSIGASTAVFASLGALVGGRIRSDRAGPARARAWLPLVAGLFLLGWMGGPSDRIGADGPVRTDVSAHFLGLAMGLLLGVALLAPGRGHRHERLKLVGAGALLLGAWALAIL